MPELAPRFSLLYADPTAVPQPLCDEAILTFIGRLPIDDSARPVLGKILCRKTGRIDLGYRREILEDFTASPSLLTKCEELCRKWEGLYETAKREADAPDTCEIGALLPVLKENTLSLMEHLRFLQQSADSVKHCAPTSGGLFTFFEYLRRHAEAEDLRALADQIGNYPLLRPENTGAILRLRQDRTGAVVGEELRYLGTDTARFRKKYPPRKDGFSAELPPEGRDEAAGRAVARLCRSFRNLTKTIREAFLPLREGLIFYHFALSVIEWGQAREISRIFPLPTDDLSAAGIGIRDLREMAGEETFPPVTVTPKDGEIFSGERGTEILRTIARTHLFAAAGLPVLAEKAVFCPEDRPIVYDSDGKTMEEEIAAIARIYHTAGKNDLVLLNHPLITVDPAQGQEILGRLLRTLRGRGAKIRLVTNRSGEELK